MSCLKCESATRHIATLITSSDISQHHNVCINKIPSFTLITLSYHSIVSLIYKLLGCFLRPQFLSFPEGTLLILLKEFNIENRFNSVANYCCLGLIGCLFCSCSLIYIYSIWFLTSCPLTSIFNVLTILTGLILFPSTVINHPNIFWFIFWPQQLWQDHQKHQTTLTLAQLDRAAVCASPNMGASSTASCYRFVLHIIWKGAGQFHDFIVACKDDLRRKVWPLLLSLDPNKAEPAPELSKLQSHPEYQQVQINVFFRLISRIPWTIRFFCGMKKYRFVNILH